jgi:hypothetical protein
MKPKLLKKYRKTQKTIDQKWIILKKIKKKRNTKNIYTNSNNMTLQPNHI